MDGGYYLAIDIGASSGRHIVGYTEGGQIKTREVYRFPNGAVQREGHLVWDTDALLSGIQSGIDAAIAQFGSIRSLSVDTWGVDYVLLRGDEAATPCYAYRDSRTASATDAVHGIIPFAELYSRTGCQFAPYNTVYQLYDDYTRGRLDGVTDFLMMPEYLMWRLCGVKAKEYTIATTTGLVNAATGEFDREIIRRLGLPERLFTGLLRPGSYVGRTKEGISCVFCAAHDTASAVEGIGMEENAPYISSGTWSLIGIKTPRAVIDDRSRESNYSNEGGVGYNRYQKNIMGLWPIQCLRNELCPDRSFAQLAVDAQESGFDGVTDINAQAFFAPESMKRAFDTALGGKLKCAADYFRCAYLSLAHSYGEAIRELESNLGVEYPCIYIVGGGAKNGFLNRLTEEATGKRVIALPIEATALGSIKVQMRCDENGGE